MLSRGLWCVLLLLPLLLLLLTLLLSLCFPFLQIFQSNPYEFDVEPEYYSYCDKPVYIQDEARLYKYSLLCEPRATGENEPPLRLVDKWRGEGEKLGWIERWTKDL